MKVSFETVESSGEIRRRDRGARVIAGVSLPDPPLITDGASAVRAFVAER